MRAACDPWASVVHAGIAAAIVLTLWAWAVA